MAETRVVHVKSPEWTEAVANGTAVYIGRAVPRAGFPASKWANSFRLPKGATRQERDHKIGEFCHHLLADPDLLAQIDELDGKVLGCWCSPSACHGNVLCALTHIPAEGRADFLRQIAPSYLDSQVVEWSDDIKRKIEQHFEERP